nr:hypothetical protein BaRGS_024189 [Batillaria attramentaria]
MTGYYIMTLKVDDTSLAEYDGLMEVAVESADTAFANDTEALFTVVAGNQSFTPDVASISYSISNVTRGNRGHFQRVVVASALPPGMIMMFL